MIRATVHFTGRVQGVGFRYTTCRVARRFEVTGYVQNLPDGRVKCVAEGTMAEVRAFCQDIQDTMAGYIEAADTTTSQATSEFADFTVRH